MAEHRSHESWDDLRARLAREWADTRTQLARAQETKNFDGWKPSADR